MIGRGVVALAVAYVATVASLTAWAFRPGGDLGVAEVTAAVLTLPTVVVALPAIYVVGAIAWSLHDAGAPMLLVTSTFTWMMELVAAANLVLLWWVIRARRGPSGSAAGGASSPGRPTRAAATRPTRPGRAGWS